MSGVDVVQVLLMVDKAWSGGKVGNLKSGVNPLTISLISSILQSDALRKTVFATYIECQIQFPMEHLESLSDLQ